jgi:hypothetical protein
MDIQEVHEKFWEERRRRRGVGWYYWFLLIPIFAICFEMGKYVDHRLHDPGSSMASFFLPVVPLPTPVRRPNTPSITPRRAPAVVKK